jgi:hypothetical protein
MEFRLQCHEEFSTDVRLKFTKNSKNEDITPFEMDFRLGITSQLHIKAALEEAQRVILQPSLDQRLLKRTELGDLDHNLSFSENCICVHVKGPNVPDLFFYDLPGK